MRKLLTAAFVEEREESISISIKTTMAKIARWKVLNWVLIWHSTSLLSMTVPIAQNCSFFLSAPLSQTHIVRVSSSNKRVEKYRYYLNFYCALVVGDKFERNQKRIFPKQDDSFSSSFLSGGYLLSK